MRKLAVIILLAWGQSMGLCDPEQDTVGPDTFWFLYSDVMVAKDSTNATVWVDFTPGSRGYSGDVSYRTTNGTATAHLEYSPVSGRLGLGWIQSPVPIHIPIHCESAVVGEATFHVELLNPSGYPTGIISGPNPAVVRMMDNTNGIVSFAMTRQSVLAAQETVEIRVIRLGTPNGTITVNYRTGCPQNISKGVYAGYLGSTAWPGEDYVVTNGTLTFGPGETEQFFTVRVMDRQRSVPPLLKVYLSEELGPDFHLSGKILDLLIVPQPSLRIEQTDNQTKISWPNHGMPFVLERSQNVLFQGAEAIPHATNAQECVAMDTAASGKAFYRLTK